MNEQYLQIEAYFLGTPTEEAKQEFNAKIASDSDFAKEVAFFLQAKELTQIERRNRFSTLHKTQKNEVRKPNFKIFSIVSSVAAMLVLALFLFVFNSKSTQELATTYIVNDLASISTTMATGNKNEAIELYNKGQFKDALDEFKKAEQTTQNIEYQGLCQLQLKEYEEAILNFKTVSADVNILNNKGDLYQALALIQLNKLNDAKILLEGIVKDKNKFGTIQAQTLLESW